MLQKPKLSEDGLAGANTDRRLDGKTDGSALGWQGQEFRL
jgi:hypothetical protein